MLAVDIDSDVEIRKYWLNQFKVKNGGFIFTLNRVVFNSDNKIQHNE